ncbi:MAG TPA: DUF58 domain-containing protein [Myxococcota bacterium]
MTSAATSAAGSSRAEILPAATLYGIAPLELRARVVADGVLGGVHRSRRFGSSSEFAEHKLYAPGDDLRRLDWKAFARMDRYFVRRYEDETTLEIAIVVDTSGSMAYAGGARGSFSWSKLEAARTLAAGLAWLALEHGDGTSVSLFGGAVAGGYLAPRGRRDHLRAVIEHLESAAPNGKTPLAQALEQVGERLVRRGLVVVISDLIDTGLDALAPLGVLRRRGCDVMLLHTLDRDELELPFDGVVRFEDLEGDREVQVDVPLVRDAYLEELKRFLRGISDEATRLDLRYTLAATDASPVATLSSALDATFAGVRG